MAKTSTPVTSTYLLKGAVFALEQCGLLLRDANSLYRSGSYASAVALAAFAREELGRAKILFDLRAKLVAGGTMTLEEVNRRCADHVTKQEWAVLSTTYRWNTQDKATGFGKLMDDRSRAKLGSKEWKAAEEAIRKVDETKFKRAKHDRHQQRMRALYVDPLSASSLIGQIYHLLSLLPSRSSAEFAEPRALCFRQHSDTRLAATLSQSAEITGAQPLLRRARRLAISHLCQIAATNTREPVA